MIRPLLSADLRALSAGLAELPLLRRYGRSASKLEATLSAALARGEGLLLAEEKGDPAGLAWFLTSGTLALGGYLRLLAVLSPFQGRGLGKALLAAYEAETAGRAPTPFSSPPPRTLAPSGSTSGWATAGWASSRRSSSPARTRRSTGSGS